MGDPASDARQIAALNKWAIVQAISNTQVAPPQGATVVQAAQLESRFSSNQAERKKIS